MQVVIYYATIDPSNNKIVMKEHDRFSVDNLYHARRMIKQWFEIEKDCAEWNIRKAWATQTYTEAHIYGYCRDEHVAIVLEDDHGFNYVDAEWWINELE